MGSYKDQHIEDHIKNIYTIIEKKGSGAYGHVWKVRHKKTRQYFALKKVFLAFQNDVDSQRTFREIAILRKLQHPNVVRLIDVLKAENDLDLYLVFEHVECDLFTAIKDRVLNEAHRKYIIFQLAKGLKYVHSAGILHRDLKPSNVLITQECKIKICDFGLSRTLYPYENKQPIMTQFIATRWYRAPQVQFGSTTYSFKSDLWSLGCLIYQLYAEKPLMPGDDSINQIQKLIQFKGFPNKTQIQHLNVSNLQHLLAYFKNNKQPQKYFFNPSWDPALVEMLNGLLRYSPRERWNTDDILKSQFLCQFYKYEEVETSSTAIKINANDNIRKDKEFYKHMIYKLFTAPTNKVKNFHSLTQSKRSCSRMHKTCASLHAKLPVKKDSFSSTIRKKKKTPVKMFPQKVYKSEKYMGKRQSPQKNQKNRFMEKENKSTLKEKHLEGRKKVEETGKKVLKRKGFLRYA